MKKIYIKKLHNLFFVFFIQYIFFSLLKKDMTKNLKIIFYTNINGDYKSLILRRISQK